MTPFIPMNEIQSSENVFARDGSIGEELDTCLNTEILPPRAQHPFRFPFKPTDVNMYVSKRVGGDPLIYESTDSEFPHEQALGRLFWNDSAREEPEDAWVDRRRLCVLG